jgi:hypothetical protein
MYVDNSRAIHYVLYQYSYCIFDVIAGLTAVPRLRIYRKVGGRGYALGARSSLAV